MGIRKINQRWKIKERGQTLIEYGLLIALIALVVVGSLRLLGNSLSNTMTQISNAFTSPATTSPQVPTSTITKQQAP